MVRQKQIQQILEREQADDHPIDDIEAPLDLMRQIKQQRRQAKAERSQRQETHCCFV
jgi:hypothetical protein